MKLYGVNSFDHHHVTRPPFPCDIFLTLVSISNFNGKVNHFSEKYFYPIKEVVTKPKKHYQRRFFIPLMISVQDFAFRG